ncbi:hypothetical protein U9M48_043485 [Paspalum notatum var. saurae]|uniref:Uncharacterized protein n=1 Tax=Paspalum notatum var. saurae TaxID=547442 RepID=A0AAQ3XHE8_PASNO
MRRRRSSTSAVNRIVLCTDPVSSSRVVDLRRHLRPPPHRRPLPTPAPSSVSSTTAGTCVDPASSPAPSTAAALPHAVHGSTPHPRFPCPCRRCPSPFAAGQDYLVPRPRVSAFYFPCAVIKS